MVVAQKPGPNDDLFLRSAAALWGGNWQAEAARQLGISDRQIRRMVAGEARIPPGVYVDMHRLILEHQITLDNLADELKRYGGGQ